MTGPPPPPVNGRSPDPPVAWTTPADGRGSGATFRRLMVVASLVPIAFALLLAIIAPAFLEPLFDTRAAILGLPPIVGFIVVLVGLLAVDVLAIRFLHNPVAVGLVVAVTTTVGLFLVILAPAFVLIAVNLTT